jgi:hypothetical protein
MSMTDLAARLLSAIEETERLARAAGACSWRQPDADRAPGRVESPNGIVVYDEGSPDEDEAAHIVHNDPITVLRRCVTDREILEIHKRHEYQGRSECVQCVGSWSFEEGAAWPCPTTISVARFYGVEEES